MEKLLVLGKQSSNAGNGFSTHSKKLIRTILVPNNTWMAMAAGIFLGGTVINVCRSPTRKLITNPLNTNSWTVFAILDYATPPI